MEGTFVVLGGGIAGVSCAESLAFLSPSENVIVITASPLIKAVTNVVPLARTMMQFDVEEREAETLSKTHPSVQVLRDTVKRVDILKKTLETENGKVIAYKKLCICTGASPKLVTEDNPFVIGIRDTESVTNFAAKIKDAKRIIVVGNGGIATEIVHEIEGVEMIWVIKDNHISATFVDPGAAEFFQHKLIKDHIAPPQSQTSKRMKYTVSDGEVCKGGAALGPDWHNNFHLRGSSLASTKVRVEYCCEIEEIVSNDERDNDEKWPIRVKLTNGKIIGCDFVVSATGVVPMSNIEGLEKLAKGDDGGFLVDSELRTNVKDIYAAGDVATTNWTIAEHWFQMRLWTQALHMGRYAAKSMSCSLKNETFYQDFAFELFTHVTKFFGYKVCLLGLYNGQKLDGKYEILLRVTKDVEYVKIVLKDGKMQGAVLIGDTNLEEMCENLILNQLDLSVYGEDLLNPDIDVEDYFD